MSVQIQGKWHCTTVYVFHALPCTCTAVPVVAVDTHFGMDAAVLCESALAPPFRSYWLDGLVGLMMTPCSMQMICLCAAILYLCVQSAI